MLLDLGNLSGIRVTGAVYGHRMGSVLWFRSYSVITFLLLSVAPVAAESPLAEEFELWVEDMFCPFPNIDLYMMASSLVMQKAHAFRNKSDAKTIWCFLVPLLAVQTDFWKERIASCMRPPSLLPRVSSDVSFWVVCSVTTEMGLFVVWFLYILPSFFCLCQGLKYLIINKSATVSFLLDKQQSSRKDCEKLSCIGPT